MASQQGRHIVVTGASAGIGAELCRQLGSRGAKVTLAARSADKLAVVAEEVRRNGGSALAVTCDVTQREDVLALADKARSGHGEIDTWISNAGAGIRHNLLEAAEDDMLAQFRLNALSSLWGYQAVVPRWLEAGHSGQIIDVCSIAGLMGYMHHGGYSAAKHAMDSLGQTMRQELIGSGITITTVYPGPTVSRFGENVADRSGAGVSLSSRDYAKSRNPLVRAIAAKQSTEHIAAVIIRALEKRPLRVYPHRWGNFLVWMQRHCEGLVLTLAGRALKK